MSYLLEPMHFDFLNNKDRENVFRTKDHPDGSFRFKYISTSHFERIIQDAKRQRSRKKEQSRRYESFVDERRSDVSDYIDDRYLSDNSDTSPPRRDNRVEADADAELRRLNEDALPERNNGAYKSRPVDRPRVNKGKKQKRGKTGDDRIRNSLASLAPSQETNEPWTLERSPISRLEYSVRTTKSHSECTPRANRCVGRKFSAANFRCNNTERSSGDDESESDRDDEIYHVRLHPIIAQKILAIQKKISSLLDEIDDRLSNIPLPDGDRDLRRRQRCAMEFAIRFSRNYLYQLAREMADVKRHVRAVSPNARSKPSARAFSLHVQAIEDKLILAHQLLLQALNAYCKHIPSSVLKGQPTKIAQTKEIFRIVVELIDICAKLDLNADYFQRGDAETPPLGEGTELRCAAIISKLRSNADNDSQMFNRTVQSTRPQGLCRKRNEIIDCTKDSPWRLGMYKTNARILGNRKHASSCTGQGKASNAARANLQRRCPSTPVRPINPGPPNRTKAAKDTPKDPRAKIRSPPREDEMSTMMSILSTDSDAGSEVTTFVNSGQPSGSTTVRGSTATRCSSRMPTFNKERIIDTPTNAPPRENCNQMTNVSDKQLSNLVPVIADLANLVGNQQRDVEIRPVSSDSMRVLTDFFSKYRSSPKRETRTDKPAGAPKNVQFICLSAEQDKSAAKPLGSGGLLRLGESALEALSRYREEYQDCSQSNPMYTSKSRNKPWDVVAWIADKLIEELIVELSKEFELRDVIQKLFELEFQEF